MNDDLPTLYWPNSSTMGFALKSLARSSGDANCGGANEWLTRSGKAHQTGRPRFCTTPRSAHLAELVRFLDWA